VDQIPSPSEQKLCSFTITVSLNHHHKRYGPSIVVGRQDLMGDQGLCAWHCTSMYKKRSTKTRLPVT